MLSPQATLRPDLDSPEHIDQLVECFYSRLLDDPLLAPIFLDVAQVDLQEHMPIISGYWQKMLLGRVGYDRHMMNIHRRLHAKRGLHSAEFERWLALFEATLDAEFHGRVTERARLLSRRIAANMQARLAEPTSNDYPDLTENGYA